MLSKQELAFLSGTLTFWNKLSTEEQVLLSAHTQPVIYRQGEHIHSGSQDCVGILLVRSGVLRTYLLSEDGREVTLFRIYPGEVCVLSASCLLKNITFDIHVDAEAESHVLLINSAIFAQLTEQNLYVENFSYKAAADRFSDVMWAMEQILFMSADRRLAIFLNDEAAKLGSDIIPYTHEQIAKYMGSAREVVSRMLKYFAGEGIVALSRGGVKIIDKVKLRKLT